MKEQGKKQPDLTNEEEIGSLPEKELRKMIVKMIQNLGNTMEKIQEMFNKELEELKRNQAMMKNTINEIKNTLDGIHSRITVWYHLCVESKKYNKLENITKKKWTHRYREQTSGYQWGEGREEEQYRGRGLRGTNYYV